jgi:hypothetical protein
LSNDKDTEAKDRSDANNLFEVLGFVEFIFCMIIWYDILFVVSKGSEKLRELSMCIYGTLKSIEDTIYFFEDYRNEGFASSLTTTKEIASELGYNHHF